MQCVALECVHFINSTDAERLCIPEIIEVMFSLPSGWLVALQDYIKKQKTTEFISTKHGERLGLGKEELPSFMRQFVDFGDTAKCIKLTHSSVKCDTGEVNLVTNSPM